MFETHWRLLRLLGIPISVDASWLIILVLLTLNLATGFPAKVHQYFPGATHELAPAEYWVMGLITALAFFACILLHELGHALVAQARGMPIRGITLFLFGGVAELGDEPPSAATEFLMAVAGPIVEYHPGHWLLAPGRGGLQCRLAASRRDRPRLPGRDQRAGAGLQPDPRLPARRRAGATLDPLERNRQSAAGDASRWHDRPERPLALSGSQAGPGGSGRQWKRSASGRRSERHTS